VGVLICDRILYGRSPELMMIFVDFSTQELGGEMLSTWSIEHAAAE